MKKQIILFGIVVVLLASAFLYRFFCMKDETIKIEIGKNEIYEVELDTYEQYYNVLLDYAMVHVKGKVESIDKGYSTFTEIKIVDDLSEDELTICAHDYPKDIEIGSVIYVYGMIQPDEFGIILPEEYGTHYLIDTKSRSWMGTNISLESDKSDYLSVTESIERARMIYEQVLFEMEGDIELSKTQDGNQYYYLVDGKTRIRMYFQGDSNLKDGDHVIVVGTATDNSNTISGKEVKYISSE